MKKFAALFATVLVMALSATSVFAAVSPTIEGAKTDFADGTVTSTTTGVTGVTAYKVVDAAATGSAVDSAKTAVTTAASNANSANIEVLTEITVTGVTPSEATPVTIDIPVAGITASSNVIVLNYHDGAWQTNSVKSVVAGDGKVTVTFTHLSPVMVITYTEAAAPAPQPQAPSYNYDDEPVSPKTGVLPVAAIAAGICLAGAAVCGKKVKFN